MGSHARLPFRRGDAPLCQVLACVAVLIICGGPCVVWLCWRNREKTGLLRGSSKSYAEQESVDDMRGKFMRIPI